MRVRVRVRLLGRVQPTHIVKVNPDVDDDLSWDRLIDEAKDSGLKVKLGVTKHVVHDRQKS